VSRQSLHRCHSTGEQTCQLQTWLRVHQQEAQRYLAAGARLKRLADDMAIQLPSGGEYFGPHLLATATGCRSWPAPVLSSTRVQLSARQGAQTREPAAIASQLVNIKPLSGHFRELPLLSSGRRRSRLRVPGLAAQINACGSVTRHGRLMALVHPLTSSTNGDIAEPSGAAWDASSTIRSSRTS
jgi:hypothetical protein